MELELFREWLEPKLDSEETLKRYLRYAEKMGLGSCSCDPNCLKRVALKTRGASKWYRLTFFNYVNMCYELGEISLEERERLKELAKPKKKAQVSAGAPRVELKKEVVEGLLSNARPYILLLYYSGARGTEIIEVKKRLDEVKCEGDYCYVELNWARGYKRAYVVFFPKELLKELKEAPEVSIHYLKKVALRVGGLKVFRKNWYQRCVEVCPESVCDFMQGRIKTTSAKHYNDLSERAAECYPRIKTVLDGASRQADYTREVLERVRTLLEELASRRLYFHTSDRT